MGNTRQKKEEPKRQRQPARTPEQREQQIISAAVDLVEKQIQTGEVSAQVLSHYIKLSTSRNRLEEEKLKNENLLLAARVSQIESEAGRESLYQEAIDAMKIYSGQAEEDEDTYDY